MPPLKPGTAKYVNTHFLRTNFHLVQNSFCAAVLWKGVYIIPSGDESINQQHFLRMYTIIEVTLWVTVEGTKNIVPGFCYNARHFSVFTSANYLVIRQNIQIKRSTKWNIPTGTADVKITCPGSWKAIALMRDWGKRKTLVGEVQTDCFAGLGAVRCTCPKP